MFKQIIAMSIKSFRETRMIGDFHIVEHTYEEVRLYTIYIALETKMLIYITGTEDIISYRFYTKASTLCLISLIEHIIKDKENINVLYETIGQLFVKIDPFYTDIKQYKELNIKSAIYEYVAKNALQKEVRRGNSLKLCELDEIVEEAIETGTEYVSCESETCDCIHISQLAKPDEVVGCQEPIKEYDTESICEYVIEKVKDPDKMDYIMRKLVNILE